MRLAYSYARMNVLSFGFQYAFGKNNLGKDADLLERVSTTFCLSRNAVSV